MYKRQVLEGYAAGPACDGIGADLLAAQREPDAVLLAEMLGDPPPVHQPDHKTDILCAAIQPQLRGDDVQRVAVPGQLRAQRALAVE